MSKKVSALVKPKSKKKSAAQISSAEKLKAAKSADKASSESPSKPGEPNLDRALQLALELMSIPGLSGEEALVAQYITGRLIAAGADPKAIQTDKANLKTPIAGNVGNLIFKLPGTIPGPRRLLMAHMDTVPICRGARPMIDGGLVRSGDPSTGLGADDRAGVAVTLNTALEILERKLPHPPLTFFWPIQEEIGLYGARFAPLKLLGGPKLAFNWDGGNAQRVAVGATGGYRVAIEVLGLASHAGAAPEQGVSAIAIAALAIADLQRGGWHGAIERDGRRGTSNIGVIQGGEAPNVVTDRVSLKAEARSHDPKFRGEIVAAIESAFQNAAKEVRSQLGKTGSVNFDGRLDYEAFKLADDEACVLAAEAAIRAIGVEPLRAVSNGGLDANWMTAHGIPTVTLGCGQVSPHTVSERMDIADFHKACRVALRLATGEGT